MSDPAATSDWLPLQRHYERCLAEAGATPAGVDWPSGRDLGLRFDVQLGILDDLPRDSGRWRLLDLGCGPGLLLDYLAATGRADGIDYIGIDLSEAMIAAARARWPAAVFETRDILVAPPAAESFDVVIMNGVLTERRGIARPRMVEMAQSLLTAAFRAARHGIVFNVMSRHVDWEREDLFHWGFDEVAAFLKRDLTRHFTFRADYGLFEFTTFAWRGPRRPRRAVDDNWWKA